ncbi:WD40 repeat-like protein [Aureobasidium pullulans]|nr:WD40 repeat-like protein [Aureobasidium pullulans]
MHASMTLLHTLRASEDEVARLEISPDERLLAAYDDKMITLWDITTGSLRSTLDGEDDMFFEIAFSPDSQWIAAASDDGHGRIWSTATGGLVQMISVEDERMLSLAFSPDSKSIATGSEVIRVWDVETGELQHILTGPGDHTLSFSAIYYGHEWPSEIWQVLFSSDVRKLVSVSTEAHCVRIWNTETWTLDKTILGQKAGFSPDVQVNDTTIQIYRTLDGQLQHTLEDAEKGFASFTFAPDSKVIATYSGREIMLWNIESGEIIKTLEDPERKVSAFSFSPDGKTMISGTRRCGLRVWDVEAGACLIVLEHADGAQDIQSSRGYRCGLPAFDVSYGYGEGRIALAFPDGTIRTWRLMWIERT